MIRIGLKLVLSIKGSPDLNHQRSGLAIEKQKNK